MTNQEACIILNLMNGIGPARLNALLAFCGTPEDCAKCEDSATGAFLKKLL